MPESVRESFPGYEGITAESNIPEEHLTLHRRQTLELVRAFSRLQDPIIRKRVIDVVRAIAESETINGPQSIAAE